MGVRVPRGYKKTDVGVIPEEWAAVHLGDVFALRSGSFLPSKKITKGPFPVYGGNGVSAYHNEFCFQEPKLVIGRVGAKCGCIHVSEENSWITDNALYISEVLTDADFRFLFYLMCSLNLNSFANQNAQPVISGKKIYAIQTRLPPLPEQKKIAEVLMSVDDTIEATRKVIDQTKRVKQGLLQELLTKGIGHTKFKKTEIGVIPEEWEVKTLKQISPKQSVGLVINPSTYYSSEGTIPLLVGSNVSENSIDASGASRITNESNESLTPSRLTQGDLVMVRVGEPGVTAVVPSELDGCNCASMMIIRKHSTFDSFWLCCMLNSPHGLNHVAHVQYGTAQKQFNIGDAINFKYPVPSLQEQKKIADVFCTVYGKITAQENELDRLQTLKKGLMQDLLTGKVRVRV